jgi:hypothetical protein
MCEKIRMRKNVYYTEEVILQFSSAELNFFCRVISFKVRTVSCSTHAEKILDLAPRVHKPNLGHCCSRLYYAMSQSSKICNILLISDILHITPEEEVQ